MRRGYGHHGSQPRWAWASAVWVRWALCGLLCVSAATAHATPLLGTIEFRSDNLSALTKWQSVLAKISLERPIYATCSTDPLNCPLTALVGWRDLIKAQQGKPVLEQLAAVNAYANRYPYKTDLTVWQLSDYWASPKEFLEKSGDCEDYVILKFVTLRALGIPNDRLRLVVVQDTVRRLAHAVLAVYHNNEVYILDSLFDAVLAQSFVRQYRPYYSVNETTRWAHLLPRRPQE